MTVPERPVEALREALDIIDHLLDQQAMPDDWHVERVAKLRTLVDGDESFVMKLVRGQMERSKHNPRPEQFDHEPDNPQGVWCCAAHRDEFNARRDAGYEACGTVMAGGPTCNLPVGHVGGHESLPPWPKSDRRAKSEAVQTVGELVEQLGERAAMTHIVAYNIKLRMAVVDALTEWAVGDLSNLADAMSHLRAALNDGGGAG
jgi:hypothetical protein